MPETLTDVQTGEVYTVEYEEQMASDLFPWLRGTEWDKPMTVGRMVRVTDNKNEKDGE